MNYYNEFDPFTAAWLRELIKDNLIPQGVVDERSITEVQQSDLRGFTQCHFFAGIGGWSLALQLAGWSTDRPVWTGSPPCQPFSTAGNNKGKYDERHLWPVFFNLIRECKPPVVFGEQVASAIRHEWFDDLQTDMEKEGYATAMAVLPACSVNAYHKRDRLFYVSECLGDSERHGLNGSKIRRSTSEGEEKSRLLQHKGSSAASTLGDSNGLGLEEQKLQQGFNPKQLQEGVLPPWSDTRVVYCRDNKYRPIPVEPTLFPLANGVPNRVGLLRGAGNAIVPQVAAEVIKAYMNETIV